jgi:hypothetical protein
VRNKTAALAVDLVESLFGKSTLIRRPVVKRALQHAGFLAAGGSVRPGRASALPKNQ